MLKKVVFSSIITLASISAYGQAPEGEYSIAAEFSEFFNRNFIGLGASHSKMWDYTVKVDVPPFGKQKTGHEVYGDASISVTSLLSQEGFMNHLNLPEYGLSLIKSNFILKYEYTGTSYGKRQCYPGNYECGAEWGTLHPGGRIEITFNGRPGKQFSVDITYITYKGHDDRPNGLAEEAAKKLKTNAKEITQTFMQIKNIPVEVYINP